MTGRRPLRFLRAFRETVTVHGIEVERWTVELLKPDGKRVSVFGDSEAAARAEAREVVRRGRP